LDRVLADEATLEVVVVDDGSSDGTLEWLRQRSAGDSRLRLIEHHAMGPAHARGAGVKAARGESVLVLDDDVVPVAGLVSGHAAARAGRDDIVIVGYTPSVLQPERHSGDTAEVAYSRDYENHCARWEAGEPVLPKLWAGNLSMSRDHAVSVGFVSQDYEERHAVHEDRDFGLRCATAGLTGEFHRELRGDHHYRRTVTRAALDATRRSGGLIRLHEAHPELLGPFDESVYGGGVPGPAAKVLQVARREPFGGRLIAAMVWLVDAASRLHAPKASDFLFRVARRYAEHVGMERERAV
jgi:GT2 family glycosyltransferase